MNQETIDAAVKCAASIISARTACALADIEAMKAENHNRANNGYSLAYGEEAFQKVVIEHRIGNNDIQELLNEAACGRVFA